MYGSVEGVAALATMWTDDGLFGPSTTPTAEQVSAWLEQVSGSIDLALAGEGFVVPISQQSAKRAAIMLAESIVADMCNAAHSTGRFFTQPVIDSGLSILALIRREISAWVAENATGFDKIGVARESSFGSTILYRGADESGQPVVPLFERKAFGDRTQEWDE